MPSLNNVLGALMLVSPVWPLIAIASAILFYVRHRNRTTADRRLPVALYVVAVVVAGAVAAFAGMLMGMNWACSRPETGNLCGLVGVLVTGPMAGAVAMILVGFAVSRIPADQEPSA